MSESPIEETPLVEVLPATEMGEAASKEDPRSVLDCLAGLDLNPTTAEEAKPHRWSE